MNLSSPRTRASGRAALVGLATAVVLLLLAGIWFLRDGEGSGGQAVSSSGLGGALERDGGSELGETPSEELETDGVVGARGAFGAALAEGVRLRGDGRLTGVVLDRETSVGVAGVNVRLMPLPPAGVGLFSQITQMVGMGEDVQRRVDPVAVAMTGPTGDFSFEDVRAGTWFLDVVAPYHVSDVTASARVVASGSGGPVEVWVRAGGRVMGQVLRPDGQPARSAEVMLVTGAATFIAAASTGELAWIPTRTDEEGRFAFPAVPPGEGYELTAIGAGFAITHQLGIKVEAGRDTEIILQTRPGATIAGRVLSTAGDAEETESEATPLEGAQVGAVPRGLRHLKFVKEILVATHDTTGPDGSYVLHDVPPGEVDVLAMAPEHIPGKGPLVRVGGGGRHVAPDFELKRGPMVSGRVVDTGGRPVSGVRVMWNIVDFRSFRGEVTLAPLMVAGMKEFDFPETDGDGRFVAGAFPGRAPFRMRFYAPGFQETPFDWKPGEQGDEIEIVLHRGGAIEGIVMDLTKGEPVTSFSVYTRDRIETELEGPSRWNPFVGSAEIEDPGGRFRVDSLIPGSVTLTVSAPGYVDTNQTVEVLEDEVTRGVIVKLSPGASISGLVVDPDGEPVPGVQVTTDAAVLDYAQRMDDSQQTAEMEIGVRRRRRGPMTPPVGFMRYAASLGLMGDSVVVTDRNGQFEVVGLAPGMHELLAFHRDFKPSVSGPFELVEGQAMQDVEVALTEGGGLTGIVTDRHGRPIEEAMVIAASPGMFADGGGNGGVFQARTNEQGRYEMLHMDGGGYFLVLTRGDEALSPMSFLGTVNIGMVTVPADRVLQHDIVDTSAGACRVHGLVTAAGMPVSRGVLIALNFEAEGLIGVDFKLANIEADGSYEFAGLSPGEYQVRFDGEGPDTTILIEVPDAPEMRLDIALPEGIIAGRVVDAATSEPIPDAEVTLRPTDRIDASGLFAQLIQGDAQIDRSWTGTDGGFRFRRLRPGRYAVVVHGPRSGDSAGRFASSEERIVELRRDEEMLGLDLALEPALEVSGTVTSEDSGPLEGATVIARREDDSAFRAQRAETGADGRFVLRGLSPGRWSVTARADGYAARTSQGVELEEGPSQDELEIELQRGIEVRVRVLDPGGAPIAGAVATLTALDGAPETSVGDPGRFMQRFFSGQATTDGDGRLDLGPFGSGPHELRVSRGMQERTQTVELRAGSGEVELRVTLR